MKEWISTNFSRLLLPKCSLGNNQTILKKDIIKLEVKK